MKKLFRLILIWILILSSLLISCNKAEDSSFAKETESTTEAQTTEALPDLKYSDFLIVRAADASLVVRQAAVSIRNTIFESCGMSPSLTTNITNESSAYEIVVGNAREGAEEVMAEHADDEWLLHAKKQGDVTRLFVNGKNDGGLLYAVRRLKAIIAEKEANTLLTLQEGGKCITQEPINISFYGDSITTFYNVSNNPSYNSTLSGQAVYYNEGRKVAQEETWWHRVMTALDLDLCVNNAYSGDWCGSDRAVSRAGNLHNNKGDTPDMIVVYFGINDYNKNVAPIQFKNDYKAVIQKMKQTYPSANIFCCTLMPTHRTAASADELSRLLSYNSRIKEVVNELDVNLVDLYPLVEATLMADIRSSNPTKEYYVANDKGLHPNGAGFAIMAEGIISEIQKWWENTEFLDSELA